MEEALEALKAQELQQSKEFRATVDPPIWGLGTTAHNLMHILRIFELLKEPLNTYPWAKCLCWLIASG